jgi:hypothetical protein
MLLDNERRHAMHTQTGTATTIIGAGESSVLWARGKSLTNLKASSIYEAYTKPRAVYFVLCDELHGAIVGGAGIGPLKDSDNSICELRKMYLRS